MHSLSHCGLTVRPEDCPETHSEERNWLYDPASFKKVTHDKAIGQYRTRKRKLILQHCMLVAVSDVVQHFKNILKH